MCEPSWPSILQAAKLCPKLVQSCPAAELQQLCDTVKQGLVLVNGHSFLLGQVGGQQQSVVAGPSHDSCHQCSQRHALHHLHLCVIADLALME
jgi:hypothetical protein